MDDTDSSYTWILLVGVVVFLFVIVVLLCFTKASGERLFYSGEDSIYEEAIVETPALLATLSEDARLSYEQAKSFQTRHPPESIPTDITLSQYVSIQEKGVAAFEFEWDMETTSFVSARTEIQFFSGECCVQTNLPLPRNQEVYYWEAKMFEKPTNTIVSVGVATKPYPYWRLPGWNKHSVGYFSHTGNKHFNNPFVGRPYGFTYDEGDVIGVGYRHRTGTVFFTRNGRKLDEACFGLRYNLFPTIGANGPCQIHVNLGQMGFVFVEANVKKWGLAPAQGSLAPPPAYGYEAGSLLLERGRTGETSHLLGERDRGRGAERVGDIPSIIEPSNASDNAEDIDDNTPLIQHVRSANNSNYASIPIPSRRREGAPTCSPPSYSTFPRLSLLMGSGNSSSEQEEFERNQRVNLV
ncbi:Protein ssh4 [Mucor circinelloides]